ncbi:hypothetical protein VVD49_05535 [Uliginosibacterium sp. H3]|uniref:Uncharacterized protein n=1 Tax=Uliginosibacterium silvisoli TaxID=3114758 RepID=A0ABU6K1U2_9RHOO|nr:hypothetical protein [Uliginosibacterium sp. H3]
MNIAIEFHDSQVNAVQPGTDGLHIAFSSAFAHRSGGEPGDADSGYVRPVEILLSDATWVGPLNECVGKLASGKLAVAGEELAILPLPSEFTGQIALELAFSNGATLTTTAKSLVVRFSGEPHFVESFFC